jgi:hypothetical protein
MVEEIERFGEALGRIAAGVAQRLAVPAGGRDETTPF